MQKTAVLLSIGCALALSGSLYAADQPAQVSITGVDETIKADGVIGITLNISAERIGDPAALYVGRVHPAGPAQKAGLRHGDELVSVDGTAIVGKSYEQVVNMVRGKVDTSVKLGIRRENEGLREVSVSRIAGDQLVQGLPGHGTYKDKSQAEP